MLAKKAKNIAAVSSRRSLARCVKKMPDDILLLPCHVIVPFKMCSLVPLVGLAPCAVGVDYLLAGTLYRCQVLSVHLCRVCKVSQPSAIANVPSYSREDGTAEKRQKTREAAGRFKRSHT